MAESEDQPVLLTEGSFVQEDTEKNSSSQVAPSTSETNESQQNDGASGDITEQPDSPSPGSGTVGEDVRPSTAPEPVLSGTLHEVERSVMKAVSDTQSTLPDSVNDREEEGSSFNEALHTDTLNDRLDQLPIGDDVEYMAPPEDPYMRAVNYMEKHKVMQIFQKLTAEIVYHRPPDPLGHMLSELHKMKKERDATMEAVISSASNHSSAV